MNVDSEYNKKCDYYSSKCSQHLYRTKLSYQLALDRIAATPDIFANYHDLIESSMDDKTGDKREALRSVITRTHFLLLKVDFEYFLNRLNHCVWSSYFDKLLHQDGIKLLKDKFALKEFADAVRDDHAKEFVIQKIIPSNGLNELAEVLEQTTGINVQKKLNQDSHERWPQIYIAFQVRHLIEHTNARTDREFMENVYGCPLWKNSSWHELTLGQGEEIAIRAKDFEKTFDAMLAATTILGQALGAFAPK